MTALIIIVLIVLSGATLFLLLSGIALYARLIKLKGVVASCRSKVDRALSAVQDFSPDLKEQLDLQGMQVKLKELQDNIAFAVGDYNAAVRDYNIAIETFPAQILAKMFHMRKAQSLDTKIS